MFRLIPSIKFPKLSSVYKNPCSSLTKNAVCRCGNTADGYEDGYVQSCMCRSIYTYLLWYAEMWACISPFIRTLIVYTQQVLCTDQARLIYHNSQGQAQPDSVIELQSFAARTVILSANHAVVSFGRFRRFSTHK